MLVRQMSAQLQIRSLFSPFRGRPVCARKMKMAEGSDTRQMQFAKMMGFRERLIPSYALVSPSLKLRARLVPSSSSGFSEDGR